MMIFASDIDNTLIYSYKRGSLGRICVEIKDGKELSYMSHKAYKFLQNINEKMIFVPITTRSVKQYKRLKILKDKNPKLALTTNGGVLLVDDMMDQNWYSETKRLIEESDLEIQKAKDILEKDLNRSFELRYVDDLYLFTKSSEPLDIISKLKRNLDLANITIYNHRDKVYVIPKKLNKGIALERLKNTIEHDKVISSGDTILDIPMLRIADISIYPEDLRIEWLEDDKTKYISLGNKEMDFADNMLEMVIKI